MASQVPLKAWRCRQCAIRSFSTSVRHRAVGPEHPKYITIREAPQQTERDTRPIRGHLPVPRNVFDHAAGENKAGDEWITRATPIPSHLRSHPEKSREEWKGQLSQVRRQNMRDGLKALRQRRSSFENKMREQGVRRQREREILLHEAERLDEQITAPDHGIDLAALDRMPPDTTRAARFEHKQQNARRHAELKLEERTEALNELYLNARTFIVSPEQLDTAVEEAFGTDEAPVLFGDYSRSRSIWAEGKPDTVQDMLNQTSRTGSRSGGSRSGVKSINTVMGERITRIAEALTGGKIATPIKND